MDKLQYWEDLLSESGFWGDIGRWIGWAITNGIKFVTDMAETLVNEVYNLLDFTSYAGVDKFFNNTELKILLVILITFSLFVIAWNFLFNSKEYKPKFLQQVSIMVIVVCAMPLIFSWLNGLTNDVRVFIQGGAGSNLSDKIIAEGVTDLKYIDNKGFDNYTVTDNIVKGKNGQAKNGFAGKEKNVNYIDPTEDITKDSDIKSKDLLLKRIVTTDDGSLVVEEIKENKWLGLIDNTEWYYRYYIDFLSILLCLTATVIAYFFTAWKVAKIIFELAFHHLLAVFMSASDLSSGQRIKTVFKSLGSIYVVLMLLPVLMKLFALAQTYVGQNVSNGFVKGFVLIALAFAMVDGPNIVERVLGVDAGIKSGFQTLATTFMLAKSAMTVGKGAARMGAAAVGAAAGSAVGLGQGISESFNNERQSSDKSNNANVENNSGDGIMNNNADSQNSINDSQQEQNSEQNNISQNDTINGAGGIQSPNTAELANSSEAVNGIAAQMSENNMPNQGVQENGNEGLDNGAGGKANNHSDNNSNKGISGEVKKSLNSKGVKSPLQSEERKGIHLNPRSVAGTTQQSFRNSRVIGGAVGGLVGKTAGKISNKITPTNPEKTTTPKPTAEPNPLGKGDKQ